MFSRTFGPTTAPGTPRQRGDLTRTLDIRRGPPTLDQDCSFRQTRKRPSPSFSCHQGPPATNTVR
eukprot:1735478-Alexandrium_andersonii.AAC.1